MQVAGEVRRSIDLVLAGTTDGRLAGAWVAEVTPAPDASRLLVVVEVPPGTDLDAAYGLLGEMHGFLRAEIASAIDRRKTPDLFFQVRTSTPPE
ncbi:MAG: ribosome-binding factor A [Sandaracinus sp.]|nr:ribosome-binding factor A [Sandaracinus sp.]MCB9624358.1 ribosome-binding factor A [Sandaracinus sp.]MCB9634295.1 ribosome-binding factor A [Sandaracinus sp.]